LDKPLVVLDKVFPTLPTNAKGSSQFGVSDIILGSTLHLPVVSPMALPPGPPMVLPIDR
jgi:hypothetical protein